MQMVNLLACAFLFGFCAWAVLWPHFKDGVVMKAALIIIGLNGFAGLLHYYGGQIATDHQIMLNLAFSLWAGSIVTRRVFRPAWGHK